MGNRDKSPGGGEAKRAQAKLKDEGMRIVIDVLLYLVHTFLFRPPYAEMDGGLMGGGSRL